MLIYIINIIITLMSRKLLQNIMTNRDRTKVYEQLSILNPILIYETQSYSPLTYEDSLSPVPKYPFCTLGVLTAEADWGTQKGVAFVVQDNYLLTCATNCYSHQYGQYPHITFTINSNRKHGYDTYKITKVFFRQHFKQSRPSLRKKYDYALLYIQGEPNLKEKYGSLKISIDKDKVNSFTYQCQIKGQELLMISKLNLKKKQRTIASKYLLKGMPRIKWNKLYGITAQVEGLAVQHSERTSLSLTKFTNQVEVHLNQWARSYRCKITMTNIPAKGLKSSVFEKLGAKPTNRIQINGCKANDHILTQIFKRLPFSSFSQLFMRDFIAKTQFSFLIMKKFANLKEIKIKNCYIGEKGCKNIVNASLLNLRTLSLQQERPGFKGCEHISKGRWSFLRKLSLRSCNIQSTELENLLSEKFKNLLYLDLQNNFLDQSASQILERVNLPRINFLNLTNNNPRGFALYFLKASTWQHLIDVNLEKNLIGNYGCKMIRQSSCVLTYLNLEDCKIDDIGIKQLCKANTSRLVNLCLVNNQIRCQGCLYLTKSRFPNLKILTYYLKAKRNGRSQQLRIKSITEKGFKSLLAISSNAYN